MSIIKNKLLKKKSLPFKICLLAAMVFFCLFFAPGQTYAQKAKKVFNPDEVFELILLVQRKPGGIGSKTENLSGAMLGFQKGLESYYLPMNDLAQIVGFDNEMDIANGRMQGWYFSPENTYSIDANEGYYVKFDEKYPLAPEDIIVMDYGGGFGDIFVRYETLNEIWPLELNLDYAKLRLSIETKRKLPYELKRDREKRRQQLLALQSAGDYKGYKVIPNDYALISPPILDLNAGYNYSDNSDSAYFNVSGKNDLLGFSADYNFAFNYDDDRLKTPEDIRLTMTRIAYGEESMPLGVRRVSLGDVGAPTSDLISGSNGGRGITLSSKPYRRKGTFDEVTIDGTATPGWEIELYNNGQLLDYGIVDDNGQYRFDIDLNAGGNKVSVILYGPHGEIEEHTENYTVSGLVPPGETEYDLALVDTTDNLISLSDNNNNAKSTKATANSIRQERGGYAYSGMVKHGINRWLSVFATGSQSIHSGNEKSKYVTAGANMSLGPVQSKIEAYRQIGNGHALDLRAATNLMGWNLNMRTAFLKDFESDKVGFDNKADVLRLQGRIGKRMRLPIGLFGLQLSGNHEKRKDESTNTRYQVATTLSKKTSQIGNNLRLSYRDSELSSVSGIFNYSENLSRNTRLRSLLNYNVKPYFQLSSLTTSLNRRYSKELSAGLDWSHNLQSGGNSYGGHVSYDFGKFLGSFDTSWSADNGISFGLRASTSLSPYSKSGDYMLSSDRMTGKNAFRTTMFLDENLNSLYDDSEPTVAGNTLIIDQRRMEPSDEDGISVDTDLAEGIYVPVSYDREKSDNPFHDTKDEGYIVLGRPGVVQNLDIPMVETGLIDGTIYFENGNPVPGLRLELVRMDGLVAGETITTFDGFYTFQYVKPGQYVIRTAHNVDVGVKPMGIHVTPNNLFNYGVNLQLIAPKQVTVDVAAVKTNYNPILNNLRQLQNTISQAINGS